MGAFPEILRKPVKVIMESSRKDGVTEADLDWVVIDCRPESAGDIENIETSDSAGTTALKRICSRILEWSYTQDDKPVPITYENVKRLDFDDFLLLKNKLDESQLDSLLTDEQKKTSSDTSTQSTQVTELE